MCHDKCIKTMSITLAQEDSTQSDLSAVCKIIWSNRSFINTTQLNVYKLKIRKFLHKYTPSHIVHQFN